MGPWRWAPAERPAVAIGAPWCSLRRECRHLPACRRCCPPAGCGSVLFQIPQSPHQDAPPQAQSRRAARAPAATADRSAMLSRRTAAQSAGIHASAGIGQLKDMRAPNPEQNHTAPRTLRGLCRTAAYPYSKAPKHSWDPPSSPTSNEPPTPAMESHLPSCPAGRASVLAFAPHPGRADPPSTRSQKPRLPREIGSANSRRGHVTGPHPSEPAVEQPWHSAASALRPPARGRSLHAAVRFLVRTKGRPQPLFRSASVQVFVRVRRRLTLSGRGTTGATLLFSDNP